MISNSNTVSLTGIVAELILSAWCGSSR